MNNVSRNFDSFLLDGIESVDSSIHIKYCTDIISLEDTVSNHSNSNTNSNLNDTSLPLSQSVNIKGYNNSTSLEDTEYNTKRHIIQGNKSITDESESMSVTDDIEEKIKMKKEDLSFARSPSDFFSNLSDNIYKYRNTNLENDNKTFNKTKNNKVY